MGCGAAIASEHYLYITTQYRGRRYLLNHQGQEFEGGGVRPVQVFDDEENRLSFGKFQEDGDDGFQRHLALTLWGHIEQRITVFRDGKRK